MPAKTGGKSTQSVEREKQRKQYIGRQQGRKSRLARRRGFSSRTASYKTTRSAAPYYWRVTQTLDTGISLLPDTGGKKTSGRALSVPGSASSHAFLFVKMSTIQMRRRGFKASMGLKKPTCQNTVAKRAPSGHALADGVYFVSHAVSAAMRISAFVVGGSVKHDKPQ